MARARIPPIVDDPATSVAAFVGPTPGGPVDTAVRVASLADVARTFGPLDRPTPTIDALRLYFANGGAAAIVVRPSAGGDVRAVTIGSAAQRTGLHALDASGGFGLIVLTGVSDRRRSATRPHTRRRTARSC